MTKRKLNLSLKALGMDLIYSIRDLLKDKVEPKTSRLLSVVKLIFGTN